MRYNKVIAAVTALAALGGCTSEKPKAAFDPTPRPTRPGEVVTIAGDADINRDPREGEYALRSSAYGGGGVAVSSDGHVYYRVFYAHDGRVARLDGDGKVSLHKVDIVADGMTAQGNDLWLIAAGSGITILRVSTADWRQAAVIKWTRRQPPSDVEIKHPSGDSLSGAETRNLYPDWKGAKLVFRADGVPIIVSRAGRLFEVRGPGRLDEWSPPGYEEALAKVIRDGELRPSDAIIDDQSGLVLLGRAGIIRLPRTGAATSVRFPDSEYRLPPWSAVVSAGQGELVLLGGTTATVTAPRPTLVRRDGTLERLSWGGFAGCDKFDGTLRSVASATPGGSARKSDGSIVFNDKSCGRIYSFKLPEPLTGSPF